MDVRDIAQGTELFLPDRGSGGPVLGGRHACGAGRRRGVRHRNREPHARGAAIRPDQTDAAEFSALQNAGPVTRHLDAQGYEVATGIGPDLMEAARAAVRSMVDWLARERGMPAIDAYLLCSVCGDLRISEIVDVPNWTVSFYFPRMVFE